MNVMGHGAGDEAVREQLTLYALDLLPDDEKRQIASHLAEGCQDCETELAATLESLGELADTVAAAPPADLRRRVLAAARKTAGVDQVWKQWEPSVINDVVWVRAAEGPWQTVCPGVTARPLLVDRATRTATMLVRMEPGSTYSAHRHGGTEQCFVLEGDIFDGERTYTAGDFQSKAAGSVHGVQSTQGGCLLFIVSSLHDELLA